MDQAHTRMVGSQQHKVSWGEIGGSPKIHCLLPFFEINQRLQGFEDYPGSFPSPGFRHHQNRHHHRSHR